MRMADWVAGLPWYHPWRSSLQKANGHSTTWKRELFQNSWAQSPFAAGFSVTPEPSQSTGIRPQQLGFWTLFLATRRITWGSLKKYNEICLGTNGKALIPGFYSLYMILYVFIFYLLLSSHMHAVWRTLSEKNPFSNSLEIKLFCDFFPKRSNSLNKNWSRHLNQPNQHSNTKTASNFRRIYNFSPVSTRYWRTKTNGHKKEVSKKMPC